MTSTQQAEQSEMATEYATSLEYVPRHLRTDGPRAGDSDRATDADDDRKISRWRSRKSG